MLRTLITPSARSSTAVPFSKMAGAGNDFILIDNRAAIVQGSEELARRLCTRRMSVGADGLILIEPSSKATFRMRYYNSDGSAADFCANGTRCAARFAFINVIAPRRMTIETGAGVIAAEVIDKMVALSLAPPSQFRARSIRTASGYDVECSSILVGVPHVVVFVDEGLWELNVDSLGRELRHHPDLQPEGANINFVVVQDQHSVALRTYERGVEGETLSCGSGIVASVAVSALFDRVESPVSVLTRSGMKLEVSFDRGQEGEPELLMVKLIGDARVIYRSEMTPETTSGFDPDWIRSPTRKPSEP